MEELRAAMQRKGTGLKLDCPQRWNSTSVMCESALKMRPESDEFYLTTEEFKDLFMNDEDWKDVEDLCALLMPYKAATDEFSAADYPTVHLALPYLEHLYGHVASVAEENKVCFNVANVHPKF